MMRERPQIDASAKNYYKDRFFVARQTPKSEVAGSKFEADVQALAACEIEQAYLEFDQLVIIAPKERNLEILQILKERGYEMLCEIAAIDYEAARGGMEVVYQLLSISGKKRARLKVFVKDGEFLESVCELYDSANWAEREMYDMSGVWIANHPNLKRIIMPDDWHGHPLRKSYPLEGDEFARWYEVDKIFGPEFRELIGPENRDPAYIDQNDTKNFARIYHEVEYGEAPRADAYLQEFQEEGGVRLVKKFKRGQAKIIKFGERK